uniref:Retrovirus-related Pol polyprotein from transposon TNT 1-94 n=1 Tax=Tanacetum cinerariifolium TaxID=118510 RepID=A0A6L2MAL3_TANCI|nr:retrovirus-related Pol polyprotein from transposon TNT 1-94 [Tanacetum cinerariifolium]
MSTLAEFLILSGADNRPPMLEKHMYDSWKKNGVAKTKKYEELSAAEKIQADCDLKATNIILQELPSGVYSLVNHHRVSNDLWKRVQLLMQVNTKFLNSLPPEWSKFVTDVKLVRDFHTTNFDQLHAYLEQHELHANEVRIMGERNQDPLSLGRQSSFAAGTYGTRANISGIGGNNSGQQRVVKCFNSQWEGHMATQFPKPKRKRDATWFRDKVLLVKAQVSGKVLNEEELEFLADPGVAEGSSLANLSSYGSYVFFEDTNSSTQQDAMIFFVFEQLSNQQKLSGEQAFRLQTSHPNTDQSASSPIKIEAPWELRKQKLSGEQAFRLQTSHPNTDQSASSPIKIEAPWELRKVKFLASKDEALDFIIRFLKMIQVRLNKPVMNIHTDNGTEFVNQTLRSYYETVGISHETSIARSPQQNGVVERQNRTLVKAARTMLIYAKALLFLWAEAVATACYTQNRSIIRWNHRKTPYELLHNKKLDISYLHVFGALCCPSNDSENLGKLQAKADIYIFIGYAPKKKAYRIYNRRTRKIIETIQVDFDELMVMASEQLGLGPGLQSMTPETSNSGLIPNPIPQQPFPVAAAQKDVDFADSHVSTSIDHDTPSTNSTLQGSSSNVRSIHTPFESLGRLTKDHPIANVISDPSCSVSTRKQLQSDAIWGYFDAFLTSVEPKNFKQAMK